MSKNFVHRCIYGLLLLPFSTAFSFEPTNSIRKNQNLVWSDEFNTSEKSIDSRMWFYQEGGWGWGNNEAQYYTSRPQNSYIENGNLVIRSLKEYYNGNHFTSAKLLSKPTWKYGRFEIRAKVPVGRGSWPAIWMLPESLLNGSKPWPDCGEIDIMENVGFDPFRVHASIHTHDYNHIKKTQKTNSVEILNPAENYHVYSMDWTPLDIKFYVDDELLLHFTKESNDFNKWPFDQGFHLILNNAIGGFWGGSQGIDDSSFPQKFLIDYVRVYQ